MSVCVSEEDDVFEGFADSAGDEWELARDTIEIKRSIGHGQFGEVRKAHREVFFVVLNVQITIRRSFTAFCEALATTRAWLLR